MNVLIRRHQSDKDYLEFYLPVEGTLARVPWYLWTVHEDNIFDQEDFLSAVKADIEEHGEARVKMVHLER
jgi:hypothetical protein